MDNQFQLKPLPTDLLIEMPDIIQHATLDALVAGVQMHDDTMWLIRLILLSHTLPGQEM
jgi:hypothetical protein